MTFLSEACAQLNASYWPMVGYFDENMAGDIPPTIIQSQIPYHLRISYIYTKYYFHITLKHIQLKCVLQEGETEEGSHL